MAKPKKKSRSSSKQRGSRASPVNPSVDKEWKARQDLQALKEAEEIRKDSRRLSAARTQLRKEEIALANLKKRVGSHK